MRCFNAMVSSRHLRKSLQKASLIGVAAMGFLVSGCPIGTSAPARVVIVEESGPNPWTDLPFRNDPDDFQFIIVSDRTGGHRPGVFPDGVRKADLLQPEFVMSVGDLIQGYTKDEVELDRQWDEMDTFVSMLSMPFFYVPGNHDITNEVMARIWNERFGRSFYHFIYRDVLFLCLNTEDGAQSTIGDDQVTYFQNVLAANTDVRWTLVFMHKPLWVYDDSSGWADIEAAITGRPYTVFAGHFHSYTKYERLDQRYFILATTGGWSRLRGPDVGEFDHVVWVTMTDEGPVIANLLLDGIWDEDVFTEPERALVLELSPKLKAVQVTSSILQETEYLEPAGAMVRLTNDADIPLHVRGQVDPHPELVVEPDVFDRVVPPNSVEFVEISIDATEPLLLDDFRSLLLSYTTRFDRPERGPLELEGTQTIMVGRREQHFSCKRRTLPVVVDGRLDEWSEWPFEVREPAQLRFQHESWQGPEDSWFRFAVEYDESYLYVAVEAFDDTIVSPNDKTLWDFEPPWEHDAIEVHLDARPDPMRSANRGEDELREYLKVAVSPRETGEERVLFEPDLMPEGLQVAAIITKTGHAAEVAIPTS